jgi:pimeloyl-ACP methyl ester carboxylesterase
METKEFNYKGRTLFYRTTGQGPLVVLLHGFGEDGAVWNGQFDLFPHHRLMVPDLPGSGRSEAIDDMSLEGLADAVKAMVGAAVGESANINLIGHSMGGYVALAFAEKFPDLLCSLGLFHSTAYADSEEKKETRRKGIRFIEEHGAFAFLKTSTPSLYAPQTREQHPEWIDEHLATVHNFQGSSLVNYYTAMIQRPDRTAVLKESKVPVLFVMGRYDTAVPVQDSLQQSHLPPIAYIHILEHSGHMGMREERNEANHILSQFVDVTLKTA